MDVGSMISLGSYHTHIRRSVGRATIDANPIWLSQVDIQDLMRACGDGPAQHRAPEICASLLEGAHDASKFGTRQCPLDIHDGSTQRESLDPPGTAGKISVVGTFETCRPALAMSVPGRRPELSGRRSKRRD